MCGVADQDDTTFAPARKRLEVVNVVPENRALVDRVGDCGDRVVPAGEASQDLRLLPFGLVRLAFRSVLRREPVRASTPDIDESETLADAPRLGQAPGTHRDGGDAAPSRVSGVARPHVGDCRAYYRAQPVRTDEQVAPLLAAVAASDDDSVGVLFDGGDLRSEAQFPGGGCELALQIGSMDGDRALEQVLRDLGKLAPLRGEDGAPLRRRALSRDRVSNPEAIERAHRVRE
jgi:hypothetical protein